MRQRSTILVLVSIWMIFFVSPGGCAEGDTEAMFRVLVGGLLIDGTGADPVDDAAVVISGGRILYAGPRNAVELPSAAEVVDVSGLTILPGFINAHVHRGLSVRNLEAWARADLERLLCYCARPPFANERLQWDVEAQPA